MKQKITLIALLLLALSACEKDDICVEATTPQLIIRFYDFSNPTQTKQLTNAYIWAEGKDSIYKNATLDSIAIPLNLAENTTQYFIENNSVQNQLNLQYNRNDIFVSRSCGYKTIFENIEASSNSSSWIKEITLINTTIENENSAQIHIFH